MKPTQSFIEEKFSQFNRLCFEGVLPQLPVKLTKARTFLGKVTFQRQRGFFGGARNSDFALRISTEFDLPEEEWEDVVIHELIHCYIAFRGLRDSSAHGPVFRKMMEEINSRYGRHVTVRHRLKEGQLPAMEGKTPMRCICASQLADGKWGVTKCTPEKMPYIRRMLPRHYRLRSAEWYRSDDAFWARYPLSRTPKIYKISETDLFSHLSDAEKL